MRIARWERVDNHRTKREKAREDARARVHDRVALRYGALRTRGGRVHPPDMYAALRHRGTGERAALHHAGP